MLSLFANDEGKLRENARTEVLRKLCSQRADRGFPCFTACSQFPRDLQTSLFGSCVLHCQCTGEACNFFMECLLKRLRAADR